MKNLHKRLVENIYFMALHHSELNERLANDLSRSTELRAAAKGRSDAYSYVVQMCRHNETIGKTDYRKIHKMTETFPKLFP